MVSRLSNEEKIAEWFVNFQKEHEFGVVDYDIMYALACALSDDIPLGYEASRRLANWIFVFLNNTPQSSKNLTKNTQKTIKALEKADEKVTEALHEYYRAVAEVVENSKVLGGIV